MSTVPALPGRLVLLGHPVSHSVSPALQGAALAAAGIPLRYDALDVLPAQLLRVLEDMRGARAAGNVTIPHKRAVFEACDDVSETGRQAEAVNTFWVRDGRLCGDNTDVDGFDRAAGTLGVQRGGAVVALLGAGGAAAAVCCAVSRWPGARVRVVARRPAQAQALAARFSHMATAAPASAAVVGATLVVNATPVGLSGEAMPVDVSDLPRDAHVMDLVYRAGLTPWVRAARARGLTAMDGREMLLQQGALSFRRWFGRDPDVAVMRSALERATA